LREWRWQIPTEIDNRCLNFVGGTIGIEKVVHKIENVLKNGAERALRSAND
jgi:hypothetical protein